MVETPISRKLEAHYHLATTKVLQKKLKNEIKVMSSINSTAKPVTNAIHRFGILGLQRLTNWPDEMVYHRHGFRLLLLRIDSLKGNQFFR